MDPNKKNLLQLARENMDARDWGEDPKTIWEGRHKKWDVSAILKNDHGVISMRMLASRVGAATRQSIALTIAQFDYSTGEFRLRRHAITGYNIWAKRAKALVDKLP